MPFLQPYRCFNCGHRFEEEILTPEEVAEWRRQRRPFGGEIRCPKCERNTVRKGSD